ncbi:MAG: hypothetical protein Q7S36_02920, partial [Candidatus Liptonbacteria bacterium]|nr:hypothetical protein [Candidatus Liptonbacteria bacterium]
MKIPRKNIFKKMLDIRKPKHIKAEEDAVDPASKFPNGDSVNVLAKRTEDARQSRRLPWKSLLLGFLVALIFGGVF